MTVPLGDDVQLVILKKEDGSNGIIYRPKKDQDTIQVGSSLLCHIRINQDNVKSIHFTIYVDSMGQTAIRNNCKLVPISLNGDDVVDGKKILKSGDIIQLYDNSFKWESKSDARRIAALMTRSERKAKTGNCIKTKQRITIHKVNSLKEPTIDQGESAEAATPKKAVETPTDPPANSTSFGTPCRNKENKSVSESPKLLNLSLDMSGTLKTSYTPATPTRSSSQVRKSTMKMDAQSPKTPAKNVLTETIVNHVGLETPLSRVKKSMHLIDFTTPQLEKSSTTSTPKRSATKPTPSTSNLLKSAIKNSAFKKIENTPGCLGSAHGNDTVESVESSLLVISVSSEAETTGQFQSADEEPKLADSSEEPQDPTTDDADCFSDDGVSELIKSISSLIDEKDVPDHSDESLDQNAVESPNVEAAEGFFKSSEPGESSTGSPKIPLDESSKEHCVKVLQWIEDTREAVVNDSMTGSQNGGLKTTENVLAGESNETEQVLSSRYSNVTPNDSMVVLTSQGTYDAVTPRVSILDVERLKNANGSVNGKPKLSLAMSPVTRLSLSHDTEVLQNYAMQSSLRSTRKRIGNAIATVNDLSQIANTTFDANETLNASSDAIDGELNQSKADVPNILSLDDPQPKISEQDPDETNANNVILFATSNEDERAEKDIFELSDKHNSNEDYEVLSQEYGSGEDSDDESYSEGETTEGDEVSEEDEDSPKDKAKRKFGINDTDLVEGVNPLDESRTEESEIISSQNETSEAENADNSLLDVFEASEDFEQSSGVSRVFGKSIVPKPETSFEQSKDDIDDDFEIPATQMDDEPLDVTQEDFLETPQKEEALEASHESFETQEEEALPTQEMKVTEIQEGKAFEIQDEVPEIQDEEALNIQEDRYLETSQEIFPVTQEEEVFEVLEKEVPEIQDKETMKFQEEEASERLKEKASVTLVDNDLETFETSQEIFPEAQSEEASEIHEKEVFEILEEEGLEIHEENVTETQLEVASKVEEVTEMQNEETLAIQVEEVTEMQNEETLTIQENLENSQEIHEDNDLETLADEVYAGRIPVPEEPCVKKHAYVTTDEEETQAPVPETPSSRRRGIAINYKEMATGTPKRAPSSSKEIKTGTPIRAPSSSKETPQRLRRGRSASVDSTASIDNSESETKQIKGRNEMIVFETVREESAEKTAQEDASAEAEVTSGISEGEPESSTQLPVSEEPPIKTNVPKEEGEIISSQNETPEAENADYSLLDVVEASEDLEESPVVSRVFGKSIVPKPETSFVQSKDDIDDDFEIPATQMDDEPLDVTQEDFLETPQKEEALEASHESFATLEAEALPTQEITVSEIQEEIALKIKDDVPEIQDEEALNIQEDRYLEISQEIFPVTQEEEVFEVLEKEVPEIQDKETMKSQEEEASEILNEKTSATLVDNDLETSQEILPEAQGEDASEVQKSSEGLGILEEKVTETQQEVASEMQVKEEAETESSQEIHEDNELETLVDEVYAGRIPVSEEPCVKKHAYVTTDEEETQAPVPETPSRRRGIAINYKEMATGTPKRAPSSSKEIKTGTPKRAPSSSKETPQRLRRGRSASVDSTPSIDNAESEAKRFKGRREKAIVFDTVSEESAEKTAQEDASAEAEVTAGTGEGEPESSAQLPVSEEPHIETNVPKETSPVVETPSGRRGARVNYRTLAGQTPKRAVSKHKDTPVKPRRGRSASVDSVASIGSETNSYIAKRRQRRLKNFEPAEETNTPEVEHSAGTSKSRRGMVAAQSENTAETPEPAKKSRRVKIVDEPVEPEKQKDQESHSEKEAKSAEASKPVEKAPAKKTRGKKKEYEVEAAVEEPAEASPKPAEEFAKRSRRGAAKATKEAEEEPAPAMKPRGKKVVAPEFETSKPKQTEIPEETSRPIRRGRKVAPETEESVEEQPGTKPSASTSSTPQPKRRRGVVKEQKSEPLQPSTSTRSRLQLVSVTDKPARRGRAKANTVSPGVTTRSISRSPAPSEEFVQPTKRTRGKAKNPSSQKEPEEPASEPEEEQKGKRLKRMKNVESVEEAAGPSTETAKSRRGVKRKENATVENTEDEAAADSPEPVKKSRRGTTKAIEETEEPAKKSRGKKEVKFSEDNAPVEKAPFKKTRGKKDEVEAQATVEEAADEFPAPVKKSRRAAKAVEETEEEPAKKSRIKKEEVKEEEKGKPTRRGKKEVPAEEPQEEATKPTRRGRKATPEPEREESEPPKARDTKKKPEATTFLTPQPKRRRGAVPETKSEQLQPTTSARSKQAVSEEAASTRPKRTRK